MPDKKLFKGRKDLVRHGGRVAVFTKLANVVLTIGLKIAQLAVLLKQIFSAQCHWTRRRFLTKTVAV